MGRVFPAFSLGDDSFAARVTGRFDALAHIAATSVEVAAPVVAKTEVTTAINKLGMDQEAVARGHQRAFADVFGASDRNPNAFRTQVMAFSGG